ncbi:TnpV protein [Hydrogenoanaerobacterium saccharovorans]|uniref:TnpV protein n=1 Tax=Hydrogenoanaerobacterium saccharovorans TaxID=474960 RepID=UPI003BFA69F5
MLQENTPAFWEELKTTMQLNGFLVQKDREYTDTYQQILKQLQAQNPCPVTNHYMEIVQWNNQTTQQAKEFVMQEMSEEVMALSELKKA